MADLLGRMLGSDGQNSQVCHSHLQNRSMNCHQLQPLAPKLERRFHASVAIFWSVFNLFEPTSYSVVEDGFHYDAMLRMRRCYRHQQQHLGRVMQL